MAVGQVRRWVSRVVGARLSQAWWQANAGVKEGEEPGGPPGPCFGGRKEEPPGSVMESRR